jgi:hypothetical protein
MSKRAIIIPVLVVAVAALLLFGIHGNWTSWSGPRLGISRQGFLDRSYIRGNRGELTITTFSLMLKTLSSLSLVEKGV